MEKHHQKVLIAILAGLVVVVVVIFLLVSPRENVPTVRIGYLNITASLPLFIAEEKEFFGAEDIQYQAVPMATSNQLVDGIVAGNLDVFVESSAVPVLALELQSPGHIKVFSFSSITKQTPFDALLVKDDSTISNLSDLAGKTVGVFPGSTATSLLKKYLTDKGIDPSTITFIPIPPQNHLAALLDLQFDSDLSTFRRP